jgi:hypothetical protein
MHFLFPPKYKNHAKNPDPDNVIDILPDSEKIKKSIVLKTNYKNVDFLVVG